jgi:hypothetical protein
MPMSSRCLAITARMSADAKSPTGGEALAAGVRRHDSGCAPLYAGLMKLLSRCADSTRAEPGVGRRVSRTLVSIASSTESLHATDVGQNAVTPYRGRREATSAIAGGPSSTSCPSTPCTCTSMKPGTIVQPDASIRVPPPASTTRGSMATMRSPSISRLPPGSARSGRTRSAPARTSIIQRPAPNSGKICSFMPARGIGTSVLD